MGSGLAAALGGAALVALTAWMWAGRSPRARWWAGRPFGPRLALGLVPGLGLLLLAGGALTVIGTAATPAVVLLLFGLALVLGGTVPYLPEWWGPAWYRRLPPGRRDRDIATPLAAALEGHLGTPAESSAGWAVTRLGGRPPLGSWRAGWVRDPDTDERAHGMARRGTVDGRLLLHAGGLVFAASRAEDVLRGHATVMTVAARDVVDVRVVRARAGADGRPRPGRLHRSWFPRLVVETPAATHVFEVAWGRAPRVAERLRAVTAA